MSVAGAPAGALRTGRGSVLFWVRVRGWYGRMGGSGPGPWEVAVRRLLIPVALAAGALWWWALLRLVFEPADSGAVEGAVAFGGWGLGLLPVHCVPGPVRRARRRAAEPTGTAGGTGPEDPGGLEDPGGPREPGATRASTLHRSGEGSAPS